MIRTDLAESEASKTLSRAGITAPPTDPDRLAAHLLLTVKKGVPLVGRRGDWDPSTTTISLAPQPTAQSGRFAFCHEIGHAVLGHDRCGGVGPPSTDAQSLADAAAEGVDFEAEADTFAAFLLVPRPWLRRDVKNKVRLAELLVRYDVSKAVMLIAVKQYKLLNKIAL